MSWVQPHLELGSTDMRQLRHHTKTALASILNQLTSGLSATNASRRVAAQLERQVTLTSQIADSLFGLTRSPGPFADRLLTLCESVVELNAEPEQCLTLVCRAEGQIPEGAATTVLRIAHELVSSVVRHGMCARLIGRIEVTVTAQGDGVLLEVRDDGWDCGRLPDCSEGLALARALTIGAGGQLSMIRQGECTIAEAMLPPRHDA